MSFASQTKKELTMVQEAPCCQRAELEALITANGRIHLIDGRRVLDVETENVAIARRIYTMIRALFDVHPVVLVRKKMRLKKNNVYAIRLASPGGLLHKLGWQVGAGAGSTEILGAATATELPVGSLPPVDTQKRKPCCKRAYLRGAFLAAGSVNDPGSNSYHLEIGAGSDAFGEYLMHMMNTYDLHAKSIRRKKNLVVYLKEGEKIVEFLSVIGAHQALLKFEDVRIIKGMRNQVNRLVNCETANLNKTILAAVRQLEVIQLIQERVGLGSLPDHLREVAELRLQYPDVNLQELANRLQHRVSKSGLNHRFRKLEQIADELRHHS